MEALDDDPVEQIGGTGFGCAIDVGQIGGVGFAFGTPASAGGACVGESNDQTSRFRGCALSDPFGEMAVAQVTVSSASLE